MKSVSIAATVAITAVLAVSAAAQSTSDQFLDYYIVKVKPEKRADFDNAAKKIVDANRKNHGSEWLAYQIEYGESNTVYFVSSRQNMAAIDSANEAFMKAMKASFGANFESIFHEMDNCTLSARGELRRRRWDLSSNVPQNPDDLAKITGNARWVRTTMIRGAPGAHSSVRGTVHCDEGRQRKEVSLPNDSRVAGCGRANRNRLLCVHAGAFAG